MSIIENQQGPPLRLQDLPPRWAHFCLGVDRFIARDLGLNFSGRKLLVACSGGVDSTALLYAFVLLARMNNNGVVAAHFNHRLRPEAEVEAGRVRELCERLGVELLSGEGDVAGYAEECGVGLEEAGRDLRYGFLRRKVEESQAAAVLVGHHLDDLAEDQLMRLIRGVGWPELGGMPAWDGRRKLLRPFLLTPKRLLVRFAEENGLPWSEDASNADLRLRRNRLRHALMPLFLQENPNYLRSSATLWRLARLDGEHWREELSAVASLKLDGNRVSLSREELVPMRQALRLRVYKEALAQLGCLQPLAATLLSLEETFLRGGRGDFQFSGGRRGEISNAGVVFSSDEDQGLDLCPSE